MKNDNLKKELIPIIALLVFIAVVLILCAVSAAREKEEGQESAQLETAETAESLQEETQETAEGTQEEASGTETGEIQEEGPVEVQETIELEEEAASESASAEGETEEESAAQGQSVSEGSGQSVSGNQTAAVKKTNTQMLAEMMEYWSKGNVEAVEDLSGLAHYRAMSAALPGTAYFYYYGERNEQGRPDGTGIAVYGEDQYYYGSWADGKRNGEGMWLKMYYENTANGQNSSQDPALISHSYNGTWENNLPNGEGHEQYGIQAEKMEQGSRHFQNVMGNFQDGLYEGEMYILTIDSSGNVQEWYGTAEQGVFETFEGRDQEGRVPICQGKQNPDSHLWINALDNKDQGIGEVIEQLLPES